MADNFSIYDYGDLLTPNSANNADLFCLEQQIAVPSPILVSNSASFPPVNYLGDPYESVDGTAMNTYYSYGSGDTNNSSTSTSESPSCYNQRRRPSPLQRSMSGHLLQNHEFHHPAAAFSYLNNCHPEILSMETGPTMRKVVSTGDMQDRFIIEESMKPVARYSAEERKERIERYRSKRNQRNFNKKIQYVCRKTLADNRPRIKGRFMRNEETNNEEIISSTNRSQLYKEEQQDHNDIWTSLLDELLTIN